MLAKTYDTALSLPQLAPRRWLIVKRPAFIQVLIQSQPFRVFQMILGFLLMAVGPLLLAPTPGPFGTIVFAFGLALILRNSPWARRRYVRYSRRDPRVQKMVNFGLRRKQKRKIAAPVAAAAAVVKTAEPGA
ncbi:MAG: hypothetical protein ACOYKQ_09795 [Polymorphobacter sp.]